MINQLALQRWMTMNKAEDYKILNVSKKAFEDYKKISQISSFKNISGLQNKHFFILAMALGFKNDKYEPFEPGERHSGGYCRVETLSSEDKSVIKAISISKNKDINLLIDPKIQYQIAESYANAGIKILKNLVNEAGDFFLNMQAELQK